MILWRDQSTINLNRDRTSQLLSLWFAHITSLGFDSHPHVVVLPLLGEGDLFGRKVKDLLLIITRNQTFHILQQGRIMK